MSRLFYKAFYFNYANYCKGQEERTQLYFHQQLLSGRLPLCIGGGIGQSRLCMVLLQKAHIGEIQASIWPDEMRRECAEMGIRLI